MKITNKEELGEFFKTILGEELHRNYTQMTRPEQIFYDNFIENMVNSYNQTDFSVENIKKHMTAENIEAQKEKAYSDYTFEYDKIEQELQQEINKNAPAYDAFFDDDLDKEENFNSGKSHELSNDEL